VSVPANTAEGFGRWSPRDFCRFLTIAGGELETHLLIAEKLGSAQPARLEPVLDGIQEVTKMIYSMIGKIRSRQVADDRE
jgi:four helix bundle protein